METLQPLTEREISLIKATREKILKNKLEVRRSFYNKIFEIAPETKSLFREGFLTFESLPDSFEFMYQHLDNLTEVKTEIKRLGLKHKTYKVKPKHYPVVREALIWTFQQYLGNDFTVELREAWIKIFNYMSKTMILGAKRK